MSRWRTVFAAGVATVLAAVTNTACGGAVTSDGGPDPVVDCDTPNPCTGEVLEPFFHDLCDRNLSHPQCGEIYRTLLECVQERMDCSLGVSPCDEEYAANVECQIAHGGEV